MAHADRVRPLSLATQDGWELAPDAMTVLDRASNAIVCNGPARFSALVSNLRFELAGQTTAFRPAVLRLRLGFTTSATAIVRMGDTVIGKLIIDGRNGPALGELNTEITNESERAVELRVTVDVHFQDAGRVLVAESGSCAPEVVQSYERRYTTTAYLLVVSSLLLLLGGAVNVLAYSPTLVGRFGGYAIFGSAVIAIWGLLGLPNLKAIDGRKIGRWLYAATRRWRMAVATSTTTLALVGVLSVGNILEMKYQHGRYVSDIEAALEASEPEQPLRAAFVRFPWRREAQIVLERTALDLRPGGDIRRLQRTLQTFVDDGEFERASLRPKEQHRRYLSGAAPLNDPALWYVSLLIESDTPAAYDRALKILEKRTDDESQLHRLFIDLNRAMADPPRADAIADHLRILISTSKHSWLSGTFAYQMAEDALGSHSIWRARIRVEACAPRGCTAKERMAIDHDLSQAVKWYRAAIDTRRERVTPGITWIRPPYKLRVFHILAGGPEISGNGYTEAIRYAESFDTCAAFIRGPKTPKLKDLLLGGNIPFGDRAAWRAGTIRSATVNDEIRKMLPKGWTW